MNTPIEKPAVQTPGKTGPEQDPKHSAPKPGTPSPATPSPIKPDHDASPKRPDVIATPAPAPKQMSQSMPSSDELKGKWQQQIGAAKIMWGKLTDDELLKLEGHEQKLAGLVQERYAITREAAALQAREFFASHMA
jgi:uncharacterized protein YjbJ (UPF0337 family)